MIFERLKGGNYTGVMVIRPDMIFKPRMKEAIEQADLNKLLFSFKIQKFRVGPDDEGSGITAAGNDRIADMIVWIPIGFLRDQSIIRYEYF